MAETAAHLVDHVFALVVVLKSVFPVTKRSRYVAPHQSGQAGATDLPQRGRMGAAISLKVRAFPGVCPLI
jgi:hypothetical protein